VSFFLRKVPITRDVRLIGSRVTAPEGKDVPPKFDSPCNASSKHHITEEVNYQCAQRITNVASTGATTSGNPYLRAVLGEVAWAIAHTKDNYLSAFYHRVARRRGKQKAIIALAHP